MATTYARDLTGNGMGECLGELFMLSESAHWSCEVELPAEPGDYVPKAIKTAQREVELERPWRSPCGVRLQSRSRSGASRSLEKISRAG